MSEQQADERYTRVAIVLHWFIALAILSQFVVGPVMTRLPVSEAALTVSLYQVHKSVGILIVILTILRVSWRFTHTPPAPIAELSAVQVRVSTVVHVFLYLIVLLLVLIGWAMVSASPYNIPTILFGQIPWPHIGFFENMQDKATTEASLKTLHAFVAYGLLAVICLHIAAALRHQFLLGHNIMDRMRPYWRRAKPDQPP